MANQHDSDDRPLRAVTDACEGAGREDRPAVREDPTTGLREALDALETKVRTPDGTKDLSRWLRDVERIVAEIRSKEINATREEIRAMIDQLLELNAQVQNLVRLKQILS